MSKKNKRPTAVLLINKLTIISVFIFKAKEVVQTIANNIAIFATPSPTLANVTTRIVALEAAQTIALTRVPGAAALRNIAFDLVLLDMHNLMAYVQAKADAAANEAASISIIQSSGFALQVNGVRVKAPLTTKTNILDGQVTLVAKSAGRRASYEWQQSDDRGETWTTLTSTLQAKTVVEDLETGLILWFRVRAILARGPLDWSDPVSAVVQ